MIRVTLLSNTNGFLDLSNFLYEELRSVMNNIFMFCQYVSFKKEIKYISYSRRNYIIPKNFRNFYSWPRYFLRQTDNFKFNRYTVNTYNVNNCTLT